MITPHVGLVVPTFRKRALALACLASLAGAPGIGSAQSRTDAIATSGQAAPGSGSTFSSFARPVLNDAGQLAFISVQSNGLSALYRSEPDLSLTSLAQVGQAALPEQPFVGAGTWSAFVAGPVIGADGRVGFFAQTSTTRGVFRTDAGTRVSPVLLAGTSLSVGNVSQVLALDQNDSGQMAFLGTDANNSFLSIFRTQQPVLGILASRGQAAPGTASGVFTSLSGPVINRAGQVSFVAGIGNHAGSQGIYRAEAPGASPGLTPIALQGQSLPGGSGTVLGSLGAAHMGDGGHVAFSANLTGSVAGQGVYRSSAQGNTLIELARSGQEAPGTRGGRFQDFSFSAPRVNASGQVAFRAMATGGESSGGLYRSDASGTALTAIALQGQRVAASGNGTFAAIGDTLALSDLGVLAFQGSLTGGSSGGGLFLGDGRDTLAVRLLGDLVGGKPITFLEHSADGLNRKGQLAYRAGFADGSSGVFLYTPELRWRGSSSGSWDDINQWTLGLAPESVHDVVIDPGVALTVNGPSGQVAVRSLKIGGGTGQATLNLAGGALASANPVLVTQRGVLTGSGVISAQVVNEGEVRADGLVISGGLENRGTVRGATSGGRSIQTQLNNLAGGVVRTDAGETLQLSGAEHRNRGGIEVRGGELQVKGTLHNLKEGRVLLLNGGIARFDQGLSNSGQLQVTFGGGEVFGALTNQQGGLVVVSGNANVTFHGPVESLAGSELRVSQGSTAVFFDQVRQRTGALFTGGGTKFYEGGLSIGDSPGFGRDAGSVAFGSASVYEAEIGGLTACTQACADDASLRAMGFDRYVVDGTLTLGGTLKLVSWNSFVAQAGQRFDLFDWGQLQGRFDAIDATGFQLAEGTELDYSRLYTTGEIGVMAVPEPETWALLLSGLAVLGWHAHGRRAALGGKVSPRA